ncbi:MAG: hypothetical protein M1114_05235 [Candidatus Dependentiae bacterium]|nr:hypothetical protein [Candidatus Dependentiae bacterium]
MNIYWHYIKLILTGFTAILIPAYWYNYGPQNFLWLSDIGLFLTVIALWMDSPLIMSITAVGILSGELAWNIDFFSKIILNSFTTGMSDYMFSSAYPIALRALSGFHIALPIIWILYLAHYGYDKQAIYYFIVLYWIVLLVTYLYTDPVKNINWVFLPQTLGIQTISPLMWVIFLAIFFPLLICLPTHYVFTKVFKIL